MMRRSTEREEHDRTLSERTGPDRYLVMAAEVLEEHFEDVYAAYEARLCAMGSPLLSEGTTRGQLKAQARSVLEDAAACLRGRAGSIPERMSEGDGLSAAIGAERAREGVHPSESLRAVAALSEAALSVVIGVEPPFSVCRGEVAAVALAVQRSILERVARAGVSYGNYLLRKAHESQADERRRIGRELHDRVAHSIMVAFRNLELLELYREQGDELKAKLKLELAKKTAQEALKTARDLSKELRTSSAETGLEVALSEYLRLVVPRGIEAWVSVDGDERLVSPEVRDELFLVLREAVRNAVAHSGASTIEVGLSVDPHKFEAVIEDDGCGFDPAAAASAGGSGLASMRERVSLMGGTFGSKSGPGIGTRISVLVPLARDGS